MTTCCSFLSTTSVCPSCSIIFEHTVDWKYHKNTKNECHMIKPTKWHVCPAKTQISLGICPVWSESLLSAWKNIGPLTTYWVNSERLWSDWSDAQAYMSLRWAHISRCWFCRAMAQIDFSWKLAVILLKFLPYSNASKRSRQNDKQCRTWS